MATDPALVIPDPFPSTPAPIIPVEEEDVEDPDTGMVRALRETSPHEAEKLARQKIRHTSQQMGKLARKHTPSEPAGVPSTKKVSDDNKSD